MGSRYDAIEEEEREEGLGLEPAPTWQSRLFNRLRVRNENVRILLAEFWGTFILTSFGIGANAQSVCSNHAVPNGNIITITLGWGLGIAMGIYSSINVSGGHINPAVTLAMASLGKVQWRKVPFYMIGQCLGAFCGSFAVWIVYYDSLNNHDQGVRCVPYCKDSTGDIWATYPLAHVNTFQGLADQIFSTALFVGMICAITDERNAGVPKAVVPIIIGLAFVGILDSYAYNCGASLNPARDLMPRIFTAIAGWGGAPFTFRGGNWFWVPVIGPFIGGVLGAWVYTLLIGIHLPKQKI